jgi:hypothetical protein
MLTAACVELLPVNILLAPSDIFYWLKDNMIVTELENKTDALPA